MAQMRHRKIALETKMGAYFAIKYRTQASQAFELGIDVLNCSFTSKFLQRSEWIIGGIVEVIDPEYRVHRLNSSFVSSCGLLSRRPFQQEVLNASYTTAQVPHVRARRDSEVGNPCQPFFEKDLDLHSSQVGAGAFVRAFAERHVVVRAAIQVHRHRILV